MAEGSLMGSKESRELDFGDFAARSEDEEEEQEEEMTVERLTDYLKIHRPEKAGRAGMIFATYEGRHTILRKELTEKYGSDPLSPAHEQQTGGGWHGKRRQTQDEALQSALDQQAQWLSKKQRKKMRKQAQKEESTDMLVDSGEVDELEPKRLKKAESPE